MTVELSVDETVDALAVLMVAESAVWMVGARVVEKAVAKVFRPAGEKVERTDAKTAAYWVAWMVY